MNKILLTVIFAFNILSGYSQSESFIFEFNLDSLECYIKENMKDSTGIEQFFFIEDSVFYVTLVNNSTIGTSFKKMAVKNVKNDTSLDKSNSFNDIALWKGLADKRGVDIAVVTISNFEYQRTELLFKNGAKKVKMSFPVLVYVPDFQNWLSTTAELSISKTGVLSDFRLVSRYSAPHNPREK